MIRTIDFLGLPLITGDAHQVADWLVSLIDCTQPPVIISHVNANNYYHLCKDSTFCRYLTNNAYLLFDGKLLII
jgi:UDP-N-acetyl-D-mannosaminuronic acid transferase (WecB/TagA/CpsF family)